MSKYKIHRGADGSVIAVGPNVDEFQPHVGPGDLLEYSDVLPVPPIAEIARSKLSVIDAETSAAILAGFEYVVEGVPYHFSYDAFDQQNFADTANVALLAHMGGTGLPESVNWNAYKNWQNGTGELVRLTFTAATFLSLYTGGAVAHKAARMAEGGARKAALAEAVARGATAEELEAI